MQAFETSHDLSGFLAAQMAASGSRDRWSLHAPFADPAALLNEVAAAIATSDTGKIPIVVQPPRQGFDTGAVGLVQIVDGMSRVREDAELVKRVADPTIVWAEKHRAVANGLSEISDQVVLISDDPHRWFSPYGEHRLFAGRAADVADLLTDRSPCRTIVAGKSQYAAQANRLRLERTDPASVLVDGTRQWNCLAPAAEELHRKLSGDLQPFSAVEICLLVGLLHFTSITDVRRLVAEFASAERLAKALSKEFRQHPGYQGAPDIWAALSTARRPFDPTVLKELSAEAVARDRAARDPAFDDLIRCCLLQPIDRDVEMPAALRTVASELCPHPTVDAHAVFARHYARTTESGSDQLLADEMEAFHHASLAEDTGIIAALRPFFSDQLDAWGKSLSRDKRYREAANVFDRAITWDPDDDYAQHYSAFNRDVEGREASRVEERYAKAIELDPDNVWWRSRYICFLVTRGRVSDARRAWSDALRALADLESGENPFLYEHLHVWVARLLLHRMRLDFAREIMDSIPATFRDSVPRLKALERHLRHLEAADRGRTVRPFRSPLDPRPGEQPERAALRDGDRGQLVRWMPGRIEQMEEDAIHIAVETAGAADQEAVVRRVAMPRADFDRFSVDERSDGIEPGRFIELAYYGSSKEPIIRVLHRYRSPDPHLPPLGFDPDRYLRRTRSTAG